MAGRRLIGQENSTLDEQNTIFEPNKHSVNLLIVIVTAAVFLMMELWEKSMTKGDFYGNTTQFLLEHGALYGPAVLRDGEWYRLFTYQFLHGGMEHLLNNMLILYFMGNYMEKLMGRVKYAVLYFSSGILAGLGSIVYNGYHLTGAFSTSEMLLAEGYPVCVGASGAVFGVIGAVVYLILIHRGRLFGLNARRLLIFLVLSIYSGFVEQGVDGAAHVAGLIGGVVLAALLYGRPRHQEQ